MPDNEIRRKSKNLNIRYFSRAAYMQIWGSDTEPPQFTELPYPTKLCRISQEDCRTMQYTVNRQGGLANGLDKKLSESRWLCRRTHLRAGGLQTNSSGNERIELLFSKNFFHTMRFYSRRIYPQPQACSCRKLTAFYGLKNYRHCSEVRLWLARGLYKSLCAVSWYHTKRRQEKRRACQILCKAFRVNISERR